MDPETFPQPTAERAALVRAAADLIGREPLAREIRVSPQAVYHWMDRKRAVKDGVLDDIHAAIDRRLTALDQVARRIRAELAR